MWQHSANSTAPMYFQILLFTISNGSFWYSHFHIPYYYYY